MRNIAILILLFLCVALFLQMRSQSKTNDNLLESLQDKNRVISTSAHKLKTLRADRDSLLLVLQKGVDKHTQSSTVVAQRISDTIYLSAPTIHHIDTVHIDSTLELWPIYEDFYHDKWTSISAMMGKDGSKFSYTIRNQIVMSQTLKKEGLFKPRNLVVEIKNMNPKAVSEDYRSFMVPAPKKNRLLWGAIGFASGIAAMVLLR